MSNYSVSTRFTAKISSSIHCHHCQSGYESLLFTVKLYGFCQIGCSYKPTLVNNYSTACYV